MGPFIEKAMSRVPVTIGAGIRKIFCGPESFTPDFAPIIGEAPEVKNYFVAAGLNSIGMITGPAIGRLMAYWIVNGYPDLATIDATVANTSGFTYSSATGVFARSDVAGPCTVTYILAAVDGSPSIAVQTTGCNP